MTDVSVLANARQIYATQSRIVSKAAATLPAGAPGQSALFTVAGGKVLITGIYGEVTVIIQNQLTNVKLIATPTVGGAVDLCAVVDIDNDAVGTMYNITGTLANAMVPTTSGAMIAQANAIVIAAGTIDLHSAVASSGEIKWVVHYIPLDSGATVTSA